MKKIIFALILDLNGNNDIPDQPDLNNKSLLAPEFQVEHPCPRPGGAIWTPNDLLSIM